MFTPPKCKRFSDIVQGQPTHKFRDEGQNHVKGLIFQICKIKNAKPSKTTIHKVLFILKSELPESNKIKGELPFYWYKYGPFSEVVANSINDVLPEYNPPLEMEILSPDFEFPYSDDFEEAVHLLKDLLPSVNIYNPKPFIDEIYRRDAPCRFIPLFKLDFIEPLNKYKDLLGASQTTLEMFDKAHKYDELGRLEDNLYACEACLPSDSIFDSFNEAFSSYATTVPRIFDHIKNENLDLDDSYYHIDTIVNESEKTWYTFTDGIRILYHDSYYDQEVSVWREKYKKSLYLYKQSVESFYDEALSKITPEKLFIPPLTERRKRIFSSIIDGYLS